MNKSLLVIPVSIIVLTVGIVATKIYVNKEPEPGINVSGIDADAKPPFVKKPDDNRFSALNPAQQNKSQFKKSKLSPADEEFITEVQSISKSVEHELKQDKARTGSSKINTLIENTEARIAKLEREHGLDLKDYAARRLEESSNIIDHELQELESRYEKAVSSASDSLDNFVIPPFLVDLKNRGFVLLQL